MQYDVIILGATCTALGLVNALAGRKVAVMDATALVAGEFVHAFRAGCPQGPAPRSVPGRKLYDALQRQREQGAFFSAGAHFFDAYAQVRADVLLETTILETAKTADGYRLRTFGCAGEQAYDARAIVDTTCDPRRVTDKALAFVLVGTGGPPPALPGEIAQFYPVQDTPVQTGVLRCPVPRGEELFAARHGLLDLLREHRDALGAWRIGAVAPCFDWRCLPGARRGTGAWHHLPSCAFQDPFAAIDGGHAFGEEALA